MSLQNFLPLSREVREHWIYKDAEYLQVWIEMLFRARYSIEPKTDIYEGVLYTLNYGEFIFGYKSWSEELSISYQRLRGLIKKLITENMIIKVKATSKLTIYKIVNYEKFNSQSNNQNSVLNNSQQTIENTRYKESCNILNNSQNNVVINSQSTVNQQSDNSQVTTKEERKKENKEKNDYTMQVNALWKLYPEKKGKADAVKKIPKLIKEYSYEQIERCIVRYLEDVDKRRKTDFSNLKFKNGSTFFNSGYMDYLDENYEESKTEGGANKKKDTTKYV